VGFLEVRPTPTRFGHSTDTEHQGWDINCKSLI
jgi:hypothetical protein